MPKTLAVVNQKGGVGKTTTSVNLAANLAALGQKTLLVDCDPQGNATSGLGIEKQSLEKDLYDVLVDGVPLTDVLRSDVQIPGLDVVPSTLNLAGAEMEMYQDLARETILKKALKSVAGRYDFILLDAPPSLGLLTLNVLTAAESVLIPIQAEYYALEGISQLMDVVERVRGHLNPKLTIAMVVMTMHDERINLSRQVVAEVREFFGDLVAQTVVPRNVRLSEAPSFGQPISIYDPKSKGAQAYMDLAQEVMALGS